MNMEINIIKIKMMRDGLFIQKMLKLQKLTSGLVFMDASYN